MFVLKNVSQLQNAIAKAKKIRPRVEFDHFGRYRVSGLKGYYTVICRKDERGVKTVACTCKGAENGLVCYHAASAISLHIGLARTKNRIVSSSKNELVNTIQSTQNSDYSFSSERVVMV